MTRYEGQGVLAACTLGVALCGPTGCGGQPPDGIAEDGAEGFVAEELPNVSTPAAPGEYHESFTRWHRMPVTRSHGLPALATAAISYGPAGIVFADRVPHHEGGAGGQGKNGWGEPVAYDVVLRIAAELVPSETAEPSPVFSTLLRFDGTIPSNDLAKIQVSSLAVLHGKLYAGIRAWDGVAGGVDDTFRRRLYVTESVSEGHGVSRRFRAETLADAELSVDYLLPSTPHIHGPASVPVTMELQLRSATTADGLSKASWWGSNGQPGTTFELPSGYGYASFPVAFPAAHRWVQYRVALQSSDGRVTPVLQRVTLTAAGEAIVNDTDWSGGQLEQLEDVLTRHSPGEVVLANVVDQGETSMVLVGQPPTVPPPEWMFEGILGAGRALPEDYFPYQGIGHMAVFQGRLHMLLGPNVGATQTCQGGDLVSYDFASGLMQHESSYYFEADNPLGVPLWGEGGGMFEDLGGVLVNPQMDSKIGLWNESAEGYAGGEAQEYYAHTDGTGTWRLGLLPATIVRDNGGEPDARAPIHIWDMTAFAGQYYAITNQGVVRRTVPGQPTDHLDGKAWAYSGFGPPLEGTDPSTAMASGEFALFDRHLLLAHSRSYQDDGFHYDEGLVALDENGDVVFDQDTSASDDDRRESMRGHFEHAGRLVLFNRTDTLHFTDPRLRAIPPESSLTWSCDTTLPATALPVEGGKPPLTWQLVGGALPPDVAVLPSGQLVGTPRQPGAFDAVVRVTDGNTPVASSTVQYSIIVECAGPRP